MQNNCNKWNFYDPVFTILACILTTNKMLVSMSSLSNISAMFELIKWNAIKQMRNILLSGKFNESTKWFFFQWILKVWNFNWKLLTNKFLSIFMKIGESSWIFYLDLFSWNRQNIWLFNRAVSEKSTHSAIFLQKKINKLQTL